MDINSDIYPMKVGAPYTILLVKSIYDSKKVPEKFDYDLFANPKNSLMENYDYVMCGKVFQFSSDKKKDGNGDNSGEDTLSISISFGGLLFQISKLKRDDKTGKPKSFENINLDETLYLLIKKLQK